jgi:hypothetical protein
MQKQGGFPNPTRSAQPPEEDGTNLSIQLRFRGCQKAVYENHPVLHSMEAQLESLRDQYRAQPCEQSRYALVRHEQLLAQWAPLAFRNLESQM